VSARVLVIGDGKMGRAVAELAKERGCTVVAVYGPAEMAGGLVPNLADVAIEFSEPRAAADNVRACFAAKLPVVSGTTGWDDELGTVRAEAARAGATMLHAPNFSIGVQIFKGLAEPAARAAAHFPQSAFALHITETHHAGKIDAPSGTAKMLARVAGAALGRDVPITSHRVGTVPGTHELTLDAPFEQIKLVHEARDRRVFAEGAVAAAKWLIGKRGVFTFEDFVTAQVNA
jgi:4-hydroxy-tetrahydrodipicolinate reductase